MSPRKCTKCSKSDTYRLLVHVTHIPVLDVFVEIIVYTSLIDFLHVADIIIVIKKILSV